MWWEINVSKDNKHVFATHERSCTTINHAQMVYDMLVEAFPPKHGYHVMVTKIVEAGADQTRKFEEANGNV